MKGFSVYKDDKKTKYWSFYNEVNEDGDLVVSAVDCISGEHIVDILSIVRMTGKFRRYMDVNEILAEAGYGHQGLTFDNSGRVAQ